MNLSYDTQLLLYFKKMFKLLFIYSSFHFHFPSPLPHIYHATVWLREHGHKPQKQREMSCLLSSKEVWLLRDVSMA